MSAGDLRPVRGRARPLGTPLSPEEQATVDRFGIFAPEDDTLAPCAARDRGDGCAACRHESCGWCPECAPEVPEWSS